MHLHIYTLLIQAWPRNTSYSQAHHLAGDPEGPAGGDHTCNTCRKSWTLKHVRLYDKYAPLVSQQAEEDVTQFLQEQHSFQEMMMEVTRYQQLADEIQYNTLKVGGYLHQLCQFTF